ncbi:MAG: histidine phosphatase family protein [Magnetococcales bacterium]|nr:histidine phosphatase family protein [Magnetococcales bacterium]MBF0322772.1 histidine phosphatase family protein [Magnetococcales bacterium]
MARELIIMRHAKSDWGTQAGTDFDRPLSKRGWRDAPRMGRWLRSQQVTPDHIVCSPARRARQTVTEVCTALEMDPGGIHWHSDIYEAGVEELLRVLAKTPPAVACVLLVGHNPGLEMLLTYLVPANDIRSRELSNRVADQPDRAGGEYPPEYGLVKTATVARLAMPDDWTGLAMHSARLIDMKSPKQLPDGKS